MSAAYHVLVSADWPATRDRWARDPAPTTCGQFQTASWLDAWYASQADQGEPCLIDVTLNGDLVVRLALVVTRRGAKRVLEFADLGVSDFNAPILGPAAPVTPVDAARLWRSVTKVAPRVDLIDLRKMPLTVGGRKNPLALLKGISPSPMTGHLIDMADWASYHAGLDRRVRMEFERCWRVFQRRQDACFLRTRDVGEALRILDAMDQQQRARLNEIGQAFLLDRPVEAAFYRHDLARRLAANEVIVTALMDGPNVVAALYAFSDGETPAVVRISNAGGEWSNVSPGRLIVHRTMHHLASEGFRHFDLSVGDYDYKRRLGPHKTPLLERVTAASWRGQTSALRQRAVGLVRRHPQWDARLRRLLGRPDPATGRAPEIKKGEA